MVATNQHESPWALMLYRLSDSHREWDVHSERAADAAHIRSEALHLPLQVHLPEQVEHPDLVLGANRRGDHLQPQRLHQSHRAEPCSEPGPARLSRLDKQHSHPRYLRSTDLSPSGRWQQLYSQHTTVTELGRCPAGPSS